MPRFSTVFRVWFTVEHDETDPDDVPIELLLDRMEARLLYLRAHPDEAAEAFGAEDTVTQEESR